MQDSSGFRKGLFFYETFFEKFSLHRRPQDGRSEGVVGGERYEEGDEGVLPRNIATREAMLNALVEKENKQQ